MSRFDDLIEQYRHKGLLLDTNLLLLLLIGTLQPTEITQFSRTRMFTTEDYDLLKLVVDDFQTFATTPNILTEVNNLSNKLSARLKTDYFRLFTAWIENTREFYIVSDDLSKHAEFTTYGLTDLSILHAAKDRFLVLTIDLPLTVLLQVSGVAVINFIHLRQHFK